MDCSKALENAIEELYRVFSRYPLPKYTDPCLHCHTLDNELKLHAQPLRDLDLDHLRDYAVDALMVWGDETVFRHFLPRIFEILVRSPDASFELIDPEIMFSKFRHGHWRSWPEEEQAAVEDFLHALWRDILGNPPIEESYEDIESWICSIGQCEDDLSSYLREWIEDKRQSATLALTSLLLTSAVVLTKKAGRNDFWGGRDAQYAQLQEWVKSPAVIEKLEHAEAGCADSGLASEFAAARAMCS